MQVWHPCKEAGKGGLGRKSPRLQLAQRSLIQVIGGPHHKSCPAQEKRGLSMSVVVDLKFQQLV